MGEGRKHLSRPSPARFRFGSLQDPRSYFSPLPISQPVRNTKEASAEERVVGVNIEEVK